MVRGLDLFRDYFKDYTDKYILIGGTACDLASVISKRFTTFDIEGHVWLF
jgi:hypothetical protein